MIVMARGQKRTPEEVAAILTTYAITNNLDETSRQTGIPKGTIKSIVDKHKDTEEFKQLQTEKKEEFYNKAKVIVDKALELMNKKLDTALDQQEELQQILQEALAMDNKDFNDAQKKALISRISKLQINNLSEITTAVGTLYDKMRLDKGESTENQAIKITMDDNVKELSR